MDEHIAEPLRKAVMHVDDVERLKRGSPDIGTFRAARLLRLIAWSEHDHHRG